MSILVAEMDSVGSNYPELYLGVDLLLLYWPLFNIIGKSDAFLGGVGSNHGQG